MELQLRDMGLAAQMLAAINDMLDFPDEISTGRPHPPSRTYYRDTKAMRGTAADILEFPDSYVFIVDMPGVKPDKISVQVEDDNMLVVSGERRRDKEREHKEGVMYVRMESRQGKFMKRFELPANADIDSICANYQDGVLTITIPKRPQQEPKKGKTIEVKVGSGISQAEGGGGSAEAKEQQGGQEYSGAQPVGTGTAEAEGE